MYQLWCLSYPRLLLCDVSIRQRRRVVETRDTLDPLLSLYSPPQIQWRQSADGCVLYQLLPGCILNLKGFFYEWRSFEMMKMISLLSWEKGGISIEMRSAVSLLSWEKRVSLLSREKRSISIELREEGISIEQREVEYLYWAERRGYIYLYWDERSGVSLLSWEKRGISI